ncbi:MAG: hypothetical protein AAF514_03370 [Verrucomicrobiota bacterium]
MRKRLILILIVGAAGLFGSACSNTVHGLGNDMENLGRRMQGEPAAPAPGYNSYQPPGY